MTKTECTNCEHPLTAHGHGGCNQCSCTVTVVSTVSGWSPPSGDRTYLKLLDEMRELHIKKNAGYSGDSRDRWANFRLAESLGISPLLGVLVRMSDKWIRITNLSKNSRLDMVGESLRDTLMDIAAYALIAVCLLEESRETSE